MRNTTQLPTPDSYGFINYQEVFAWGFIFFFPFYDEPWRVRDVYCLMPGCECSEVALDFYPINSPLSKLNSQPHRPPAVRYDYSVHQIVEISEGSPLQPSASDLAKALQKTYPKLSQLLASRHSKLKSLYTMQEVRNNMARTSSKPPKSPQNKGKKRS